MPIVFYVMRFFSQSHFFSNFSFSHSNIALIFNYCIQVHWNNSRRIFCAFLRRIIFQTKSEWKEENKIRILYSYHVHFWGILFISYFFTLHPDIVNIRSFLVRSCSRWFFYSQKKKYKQNLPKIREKKRRTHNKKRILFILIFFTRAQIHKI